MKRCDNPMNLRWNKDFITLPKVFNLFTIQCWALSDSVVTVVRFINFSAPFLSTDANNKLP